MAENIPPSTSASTTASASAAAAAAPTPAPTTTSAATDQPGRPYYESLRSTLRSTLEKKRRLDEQLAAVEDQIFKAEGSYLEDTAGSGNIVRGFDGWVKGVQVGGGGGGGGRGGMADDRRRGRVRDEDRVFSRSSVSWMRAQDGAELNTPLTAVTPSTAVAAQGRDGLTPVVGSGMKAGNKKKRPTEKEDEDDGKAAKRGKITYARD